MPTAKKTTSSSSSAGGSLTSRQILAGLRALKRGDFDRRLADDLSGVDADIAREFNDLAQQLSGLNSDAAHLRSRVGLEGRTGNRLQRNSASGGWSTITRSINDLLDDVIGHNEAMADVIHAVSQGDLTQRIDVEGSDDPVHGKFLNQARQLNSMVENLALLGSEVSRVAREVGVNGKLGAQAEVPGASGTWLELTENVNVLATNLTAQVREIARVTTAVANGDLTREVNIDAKGEILALKNTINTMVGQLSSFADEVSRVAREVGTEGELGGQANVRGVSGVWKELTDNVNYMAANLTRQVRNIADVSAAIAKGDLSRKITVDVRGEMAELKTTINSMVDQLQAFAPEVTRVAREVGSEGTLGAQAQVPGVSGVWRELTEAVNQMADNLTKQVRNIAEVITAIAEGDLSRKINVEAQGEILVLKDTINSTVDRLNDFSREVTRVARTVGTDGELGVRAEVQHVSGIWQELTENVNLMATNLTDQVRAISAVASAIAQGDLEKKIEVEASGEIQELKNTINTMVDQLGSFAGEVTRVSRDVGIEGKLGGQAAVEGVKGSWKELTENVNLMVSNLTSQVRDISEVATSIANGNLDRQVTVSVRGEFLELKNTINIMVGQLSSFADEVNFLAKEVGVAGRLGGQAEVRDVSGIWKDLTDNVNLMASNLTDQVRDIAVVTTAVARGDLTRKIDVEARGELQELKATINTMVDQLSSFASEVTRVAREVGVEGLLGGQADVQGVSGTWRELTDNVNLMADNLSSQVRGIATVVTAVADGNLSQKLHLETRGEIATLVSTINQMVDTLSLFADQVVVVARDVGIEGQLGGQAEVPEAKGRWRDLTENVNLLADNLTRQVRAIGDVVTAVTEGDLSRSIDVEARGEVATLSDNLNEMIRTLRRTTRENEEQDWLKTNLTQISRSLQGQRKLIAVADMVLSNLADLVSAQHGTFYVANTEDGETILKLYASYAFSERKHLSNRFELGEGLVGQAALEKKRLVVGKVPADYIIGSSLGHSQPSNVLVVPILFEDTIKGVIELASFNEFSELQINLIDQLSDSLGVVIATIESTMRTDELLRESQSMAEELQTQQEELQQTNEELEEKAHQLTAQNAEVEKKNSEVELARREIEDKAEQLALTSKYKSQFLANMSHELRTPLNSLLILAKQLSDNVQGNLLDKQVKYAETIHQSGADLLALINEILDLARIESGTIAVENDDVVIAELVEHVDRTFRQMAETKGLELKIETEDGLPEQIITDEMRLKQILRNLLSNAIKFTSEGEVKFSIDRAGTDQMAFQVTDTGIGITPEKHQIIFEAFQQADGGTARKYGGTGLGLSISREISHLLGGNIHLESTLGKGSTFTLVVPTHPEAGVKSSVRLSRPPRRLNAPVAKEASVPGKESDPRKASASESSTKSSDNRSVKGRVIDDRTDIGPGDRVLLIVEDDASFATTLMELAHDEGFKAIVALSGQDGWELAATSKPDAISLDLKLPDIDGWVLLDRLKHDPRTRHIPVHVISAYGEEHRALECGAVSVMGKPVTREQVGDALASVARFMAERVRRLLVVEDDETQRMAIVELIGNGDVETDAVASGEEALDKLRNEDYDCMVVDLSLPGISGLQLIREIKDDETLRRLPIVVYTGRDLSAEERTELQALTQTVIVKDVRSPERLLDETALFLHRIESNLPEPKRKMLRGLAMGDPALADRTVLVVDDDMRNIFAITALLEQHQVIVEFAENGVEALAKLKSNPDIDLVLMDIMMPEMDGYEATQEIRKIEEFAKLPVIALTAKAMKGDRQKCIEAGASDYVTKPVDPDQLVSLLRVWLYQ